ncbi:MAG TPA: molybdopterin-dependent oxidoreductase [Gemmatimonadales bacterium]|jgi:DMSO/TMAO reductase YedYZ molybdopterin-dependent catalytic subunit|nr:molybdopterin-dependent oxidoreductase [Gemmatimonadales bacterium]
MTEERRGLTRRDLLRLGAVAGPAALVAACGWDGGSSLEPRLRAFSRINDWIGEKILLSPARLAPEYPVSARTAMENFPAYSITYNQTGSFPEVSDPAKWSLNVGGMVRKPVRLTRREIEALPSLTYTVKHHCVEGWTAVGTWTGVPLSTITAMVQPTAEGRYLRFDSFDSGYYNGWDLTSAMHPQTILAYAWNDRPLMMNHGAPLRLYSPIKLGYKLTKYLTAMTFTRDRPGGYWEDQGYPWLGGV